MNQEPQNPSVFHKAEKAISYVEKKLTADR